LVLDLQVKTVQLFHSSGQHCFDLNSFLVKEQEKC
jgi:hypothetical protein